MNLPNTSTACNLEPVCREQSAALQFIEQLRLNKNKERVIDLEKQVHAFWKNYIRTHFILEEKLLEEYIPGEINLKNRIHDCKADMRELIISLSNDFDPWTLELLCKRVENYIQFEKNEFFPSLNNHLAEKDAPVVEQLINASLRYSPEEN
jgi:hemerythrin